jgi:hypothetical protein
LSASVSDRLDPVYNAFGSELIISRAASLRIVGFDVLLICAVNPSDN